MPACEQIWQDALRKAAEAHEAYIASEIKDDKLSEQWTRIEEEGDAAFHRCFAQRAKSQGYFAALTRQAQALVDRVPR
jgi:predicted DNA-binding WGR domain protein